MSNETKFIQSMLTQRREHKKKMCVLGLDSLTTGWKPGAIVQVAVASNCGRSTYQGKQ